MRRYYITLLVCILFIGSVAAQIPQSNIINFDEGWRFYKGGLYGGEQLTLNDSRWRKIDLPHDWSIEDVHGTNSPFNATAIGQVGGGFTTQGTAWYRKTFTAANADKGKRLLIQFDGVYMNADVYINGKHLGNHPYGYTGFYYDITDELKYGEKNVLAVEVKNEGQNSRWYSGSGIYRHVWLKAVSPVHIAQWGTFISSTDISTTSARVNIKTKLVNQGNEEAGVTVSTRFFTAQGTLAGQTESKLKLAAGEQKEVAEHTSIKDPQLWSCDAPVLYRAVTDVYQNGKLVHNEVNNFGIRGITFDVTNGLRLNGKTLKLKGGCFHHDNGPLGTKAYDRAEERKVELLKASGYNAIRCSHNPPSTAFLAACDRLGMLVIDEAFDIWNYGKNPYDYHLYFKDWWKRDIESMVTRDRNHPSIILWSIGNEIPEVATAEGVQTAKMLAQYIKELDDTRSITAAVNGLDPDKDPFFAALDVGGYNYAVNQYPKDTYADDHKRVPERVMVGTESYALDAFDNWMAVEDHPYLIGDFVWTAWDYIGEASIGWLGYTQRADFYPWNLAYCGDIDICGWKRPQSYYRDALWMKDQLSVFVTSPIPSFATNADLQSWSRWNWTDVWPNWNWPGKEGKPLEVNVYSSCDKVELFLNGKSLGIKQTNRSTKFMAIWQVPYQSGQLKAVGYSGDKAIKVSTLTTAQKPSNIKLTADRTILKANNQDLSYITVELTDSKGHVNPSAENTLNFTLTGDAKIVGVGNANPKSTESFQQQKRKAWKGRCLVIVKAGKQGGPITLQVNAAGLKPSSVNLTAKL
jgi:beta-galactosidase